MADGKPLVQVYYGPNALERSRQAKAAFEAAVDPDTAAFNAAEMRGSEISPPELVELCRTYPMMSDLRVVWVREANLLHPKSSAKDSKEKKEANKKKLQPLIDYLKAPADETLLILEYGDKCSIHGSSRRTMGRVLFQEIKPIYDNQMPGWIAAEARALKLQLAPDAIQFLIDRRGTDLGAIHSELEKMLTSFGPDSKLALKDIEELLGGAGAANLYAWQDAVCLGKRDEALMGLSRLQDSGTEPLYMFASFAHHLRRLVLAAELLRQSGGNAKSMAGKMGMHPFVAQKRQLARQAQRMDKQFGPELLAELVKVDAAMKGVGRHSTEKVLESFVAYLIGLEGYPKVW